MLTQSKWCRNSLKERPTATPLCSCTFSSISTAFAVYNQKKIVLISIAAPATGSNIVSAPLCYAKVRLRFDKLEAPR